jgi:two-component system sensor histidine kinase KdpD
MQSDPQIPAALAAPSRKLALSTPKQYAIAVVVVCTATALGFLINPIIGPHSTAFIFLLVVVVLALFVGRGPTVLTAALTAISWDYFFLPPVFAFRITHVEDALLLAMYFVVAVVLGQLTSRIRRQEALER